MIKFFKSIIIGFLSKLFSLIMFNMALEAKLIICEKQLLKEN